VIGGLIVLVANQAPAAYSCGGELMVSGAPDPGQPGLVKCYVQAVRTHDSGLLAKIEMDGYPNPLPTPPQAQSPVQARFFVFDAGMGDERVTITFADGKGVTLHLATAPGDVPWSGPPAKATSSGSVSAVMSRPGSCR